MSDSRRRKPPLVADKRYGGKPRAKPPTRGKTTARKGSGGGGGKRPGPPRKPARRKSPQKRRNPMVAFVLGLFGWIFGLIWRVTWRLGAVTVALVVLAAGISGLTMPPIDDLYDGRARGSVTILDDQGRSSPGAATSSAASSPLTPSART